MSVWWLAVDVDYASYRDLQLRQVVAQGWRQVGDLQVLCRLARESRNEEIFLAVLQALARDAYGDDAQHLERPGRVFWRLLRAQPHDLFVAIEGTSVRGICEIAADGWATYRYEPHTEYAQTIGHPLRWIDWRDSGLGEPPVAPAQGVPGIAQVQLDAARIEQGWRRRR